LDYDSVLHIVNFAIFYLKKHCNFTLNFVLASIRTTTTLPSTTIPPSRALPVGCDFDHEWQSCDWELLPSLGNNVGWNITSESYHYKGKLLINGDTSKKQGKK
jgi:hypothetical protein